MRHACLLWWGVVLLFSIHSLFASDYKITLYKREKSPDGSTAGRLLAIAEGSLSISMRWARQDGCIDCLGETAVLNLSQPSDACKDVADVDGDKSGHSIFLRQGGGDICSNIDGLVRVRTERLKCVQVDASGLCVKDDKGIAVYSGRTMRSVLDIAHRQGFRFERTLFRTLNAGGQGYEFMSVVDGRLVHSARGGVSTSEENDQYFGFQPQNANRHDIYDFLRGLINSGEDYRIPQGGNLHDDLFQMIYRNSVEISFTENSPDLRKLKVVVTESGTDREFVLLISGVPELLQDASATESVVTLSRAASQVLFSESGAKATGYRRHRSFFGFNLTLPFPRHHNLDFKGDVFGETTL